jgi:hypothetical protein
MRANSSGRYGSSSIYKDPDITIRGVKVLEITVSMDLELMTCRHGGMCAQDFIVLAVTGGR